MPVDWSRRINPMAKMKAKGAQPERSRGQQYRNITVKELI